MANKEVGAPPTLVVSNVLQIAVEKVEPTQLAAKPFSVPTMDGKPPKAGVGVPDNLPLPEGTASVGTVLWSSAANVRGTGGDGRRLAATGGTSLGSPTLAFSLQANAKHQPRSLLPCVVPGPSVLLYLLAARQSKQSCLPAPRRTMAAKRSKSRASIPACSSSWTCLNP